MSDAHAHHQKPDHVPHVTPFPIYMKTFGALLVLTAVTVGVSYVNLGTTVNLIIALFIATIKATVVAALFMHLIADHRFHTIILVSGFVFLGIFVAFTMFDTEERGQLNRIEGRRPHDSTNPFALPPASAETPATTPH